MATATLIRTTRPHTFSDLLATPEDGRRYEIIAGEMTVAAAPQKPHVRFSGRLYGRLARFVEEGHVGEVDHAPVDVTFASGDTVEPDIVFVSTRRLTIFGERAIAGAPDLIVEVLSPSTRANDLGAKFKLYQREGVPEY